MDLEFVKLFIFLPQVLCITSLSDNRTPKRTEFEGFHLSDSFPAMSLGGDNFLDAAASFLGDNSKFPGAGLFNYNRENAKKLAAVVDDLSKSKSLIHVCDANTTKN